MESILRSINVNDRGENVLTYTEAKKYSRAHSNLNKEPEARKGNELSEDNLKGIRQKKKPHLGMSIIRLGIEK